MGTKSGYRPGMKRKGKGGGQDFRWKKVKLERKLEREERLLMSGDALEDEDLSKNEPTIGPEEDKKEKARGIKRRQLEAKKRRREKHEVDREESDALIRRAPLDYLWSRYKVWAGDRNSSSDLAPPWEADRVTVLEDSSGSLIPQLKAILGDDYVARDEYHGDVPGIAVITLAASALNAVNYATRLYDGFPVGKLFSKHLKIQQQKDWLWNSCRKGLPPTAAGTAKRVQRLIEEGDLTLEHTTAVVIDMSRDMRLLNIIDTDSMRKELFELLHKHVFPLVTKGKMKIILCIPKEQATKLEDVKDELMARLNNAKKKRRKQNKYKKSPADAKDE